jgi:hypothetical protein
MVAADAGGPARNGATGTALAVVSPAGGMGAERDGIADKVAGSGISGFGPTGATWRS